MKNKNLYLLPTDKPSRLFYDFDFKKYYLTKTEVLSYNQELFKNQNIYITSDKEEAYTYALHIKKQEVLKINGIGENSKELFHDKGFNYQYECKKIILTTDQDLIKDGVQSITDEFLEWFVKNPSYEEVEIKGINFVDSKIGIIKNHRYKIIIPKEEPIKHVEFINDNIEQFDKAIESFKQETLEEAADRLYGKLETGIGAERRLVFKAGAKWQQERMYSEEDMLKSFINTQKIY